jgi:acetolactate decarboxylase
VTHDEGLIGYRGAQRDMLATGKANRVMTLSELPRSPSLQALGPCERLDGEITVLNGDPYVSRVRGDGYVVEHGFDHGAIFIVWTRQAKWQDVAVPPSVRTYAELQFFIRGEAERHGIDASQAFPFLMRGVPAELKWHINVDRTDGKPITRELFQKSKQSYVVEGEAVDIVGFYSERHAGIFISDYAPALDAAGGDKNFIHIHFVSRTGAATGHIDDLRLDGGMTLRLPAAIASEA